MGKINMNMCGVCMHKRVLDLFVGYVIKKPWAPYLCLSWAASFSRTCNVCLDAWLYECMLQPPFSKKSHKFYIERKDL